MAAIGRALEGGALAELRSISTEMWLVQAECALMDGDLVTARANWRQAVAVDVVESERVGARLALIDAALRLSAGEAAAALRCLPDDTAAGMNDELRWRSLAVRLRAEAALGKPQPATLMAAEHALQRTGVHAVAALLLHHAWAQVAGTPQRRLAWQQHVDALAATLDGQPALRATFLSRWRSRR